MKNKVIYTLIFLSFLLCFPYAVYAKEKTRSNWDNLSHEQIKEIFQTIELQQRVEDIESLSRAKKYIIDGDINRALVYLGRIDIRKSPLSLIQKYYLSIIYFIKGDYKKSYEYLSDQRYNDATYYPTICLLKLFNIIALNKSSELEKEYIGCSAVTRDFSKNNQIWLDSMYELKNLRTGKVKTNAVKDLHYVLDTNEITRLWLKIAIYTNKEEFVLKHMNALSADSYKSRQIRELLGYIYYRNGMVKEALDFIEGINSTNTENIRGNINLEDKKYELAFGHFKLALKRKKNSLNALERSLPLSWLLGQWEDGLRLLQRIPKTATSEKTKLALDTAFKIRLKEYDKADKQLRYISMLFRDKPPRKVILMNSYISLILSDLTLLSKSSDRACKKFDGLNCWIQMQQLIWEDLGKTIARKEKTYSDKTVSIDILKSEPEIKPLTEDFIIDQRDIEELDNADAEANIYQKTNQRL